MKDITKDILILAVICYVFFMLGNGILNLTNPDEVFYSGTAKEMMQNNTWSVPILFTQPQFEKPILTYWLMRFGFEVFGVSNFSARIFPALFAFLGVIWAYLFATAAWRQRKKAFLCALILAGSGFYIGMARTVFTDMIFSVFITLALVSFYAGYLKPKTKNTGILLFFVFSALAVLAKGPLGIMIPAFAVLLFLVFKKELKFILSPVSTLGFLVFLIIAVPWYALMIKEYGTGFIREFFYNDHVRRLLEAEHASNDTWYFYPATAIACMAPWSLFVLASLGQFFRDFKNKVSSPENLFLFCWIGSVFLAFQFAHSKLVSYILPMFPALAILTGSYIHDKLTLGKTRAILVVSSITWIMFLFLPAGLLFSANKYSKYIIDLAPVYIFIGIFTLLLAVMFVLLLKKKLLWNIYLLSVCVPLLLFFVFFAHKDYEDHVSSKNACSFLLSNYKVDNTILCSKIFVRGVRFYTDKPVAVAAGGFKAVNFFSPHPVPYLNTIESISDFLKNQKTTYCILNKSTYKFLEAIMSDRYFKFEKLNLFGDEYIIRISAI
ncbi:MAG: glycosyltransferase family 39 protein [Candidatus Omnitrophica bacterium]|nr:glycosyltransferase family 39 protein [Candidatus Omnitrophota bacterium]